MIFFSKISVLKNLAGMTLLVMLMSVSSVNAADPVQCKGLDNNLCVTQAACSWVDGYERKDGRKVNAFCRTKAKSKPSSAAVDEVSNQAS